MKCDGNLHGLVVLNMAGCRFLYCSVTLVLLLHIVILLDSFISPSKDDHSFETLCAIIILNEASLQTTFRMATLYRHLVGIKLACVYLRSLWQHSICWLWLEISVSILALLIHRVILCLSFMTCSQRRVYRYFIKTSEVCWLTKTTSAGVWTIFTKYKFYHSVRHIYQLMMNLKQKLMVILLLANQENQPRAVELAPISHLQCRIIEDWT